MAKEAATATINPLELGHPLGVFYEDFLKVLKQLNWSGCFRPTTHFNMAVGPDEWAGGDEIQTLNIEFQTSTGAFEARFRTKIRVAPEVQEIIFGARCQMGAGNSGNVRVTIGAASPQTLTLFTSATNGDEHTATFDTGDTGTGDLVLLVELERVLVGIAPATAFLRDVACENLAIAATDLPNPPDE